MSKDLEAWAGERNPTEEGTQPVKVHPSTVIPSRTRLVVTRQEAFREDASLRSVLITPGCQFLPEYPTLVNEFTGHMKRSKLLPRRGDLLAQFLDLKLKPAFFAFDDSWSFCSCARRSFTRPSAKLPELQVWPVRGR